MLIGYARTSTVDQAASLEAQMRDLTFAGCSKVFAEQVSSVARRPELIRALAFAREGDVLVVTRPDRLARSVEDLLGIVGRLEAKGVALMILSMSGQRVDTGSSTGKLMLTMLGAVAAFERDLMLERQREGIAKARAEGKYKGRAPTARQNADQVVALKGEGMRPTRIAQKLGISRSSVYRMLNDASVASKTPGLAGEAA